MERYCIKNEKVDYDFVEENLPFKIAPLILREVYKHYISSLFPDGTEIMERVSLLNKTQEGKEQKESDTSEDEYKNEASDEDVIESAEGVDSETVSDVLKREIEETITIQTAEISGLSVEEYEESIYDNLVKDNLPIFPECKNKIIGLFYMDSGNYENTSIEEEMYGDILQDAFSSVLVELDIGLHIYYTLLYESNKEKYTYLIEADWSRDKKEEIRSKRKEYRRVLKKGLDKKIPFEIIEKENSKLTSNDTKYYGRILIQDFAPNICRLYYLLPEFRNIFTEVKKMDTEKYMFSKIKNMLSEDEVHINRKEEVWLCEKMLGINLALELYSFFNVVLKDINYKTIEREYQQVIKDIIKEIMSIDGIYIRCAIVHQLKVIYELRKKSNLYSPYAQPQKLLRYIHKVLCEYMPLCVERYRYKEYHTLEEYKKEAADNDSIMKRVETECDSLLEKYFEFSENYCFIKELLGKIKNESLYALIQNIVINQ